MGDHPLKSILDRAVAVAPFVPSDADAEALHNLFGVRFQKTTESAEWFVQALSILETGANYIWKEFTTSNTGLLSVATMPPEVRDVWEGFRSGTLDKDAVRMRLHLAQPVLRKRRRGS